MSPSINPKVTEVVALIENLLLTILGYEDRTIVIEETVTRATLEYPRYVLEAVSKMYSQKTDIYSLANKHLLFSYVTDQEIHPGDCFASLCVLVSVVAHFDLRLGEIDCPWIFEGLKERHYINYLRLNRIPIRNYGNILANRLDETEYRLERDHAMLSTLVLTYIFSVLRVFLDYEFLVHPEPTIQDLNRIVLNTLNELESK